MPVVLKLMISGWSTFFAMIGFYALKESGKLRKMRRRLALWLDNTLVPAVDRASEEVFSRGAANIQ